MKLTVTQLRNIIREEVNKTKLHESKAYMDSYGLLMDAIYDEYLAAFEQSRFATGDLAAAKKKWHRASSNAWQDVQAKFEKLQKDVRRRLLDGGYHDGLPSSQEDDVEEKLFNGEFAKADVGIDLDSLNTKLDTEEQKEQKEFLKNLLAMDSKQLASQYSDISKEKNGRRPSTVPPGTRNEIIKMILKMAYPELDFGGYESKKSLKPSAI